MGTIQKSSDFWQVVGGVVVVGVVGPWMVGGAC